MRGPEDRQRDWPTGTSIALFFSGWLVLASPWLFGFVTIPWDAKAHFYPQLVFLAQSFHGGDAPWWNPYVFAGSPQIADPQSLIFSLPYLLLALINPQPSFAAADSVLFLMLLLGGLSILMFFRDRGWHPAGALVAAFAFSFGGSAAWRVQHVGQVVSLCFFMMALLTLSRALERRSILWGLLAGLLAGCMVTGRDQVAWLGFLSLTAFVVWHWLDGEGRAGRFRNSLRVLVAGAIGGLLVAGLPVLLTLSLAGLSNRPEIDFAGAARGSLHPASLFTAFVANLFGTDGPLRDFWGPPSPAWGPADLYLARNMSDIYMGALPIVVLVGIMLPSLWFAERKIRFFAAMLAVMLLYALGRYTPFYHVIFAIPGADLFRRPADATFLVGAFGALVAGYGVHRFVSDRTPLTRRSGLMAVAIVLAGFCGALALALVKDQWALARLALLKGAFFLALAFLLLVVLRRLDALSGTGPRMLVLFLASAVMVLDLAANNGPNESTALPPSNFDMLRTDSASPTLALLREKIAQGHREGRHDRVELTALGFDWPNTSMIHKLDNTLGYNPLRLGYFAAATGAGDHVALSDQRSFSPLYPSYRSRMADMLGLRYIATGVPVETIDRQLKPGDLTLLARTPEGFVYENPRALPRALVVTGAQRADFAAMIRTGEWPDFDPRATVLLESDTSAHEASGSGTATIRSYRNSTVTIAADVPQGGGWLVLHDVWHPWWRARINGADVPVLRANVLFRAVAVREGRHIVHFHFAPWRGLWDEWRARL